MQGTSHRLARECWPAAQVRRRDVPSWASLRSTSRRGRAPVQLGATAGDWGSWGSLGQSPAPLHPAEAPCIWLQ